MKELGSETDLGAEEGSAGWEWRRLCVQVGREAKTGPTQLQVGAVWKGRELEPGTPALLYQVGQKVRYIFFFLCNG